MGAEVNNSIVRRQIYLFLRWMIPSMIHNTVYTRQASTLVTHRCDSVTVRHMLRLIERYILWS